MRSNNALSHRLVSSFFDPRGVARRLASLALVSQADGASTSGYFFYPLSRWWIGLGVIFLARRASSSGAINKQER
jgi:hypothetical protein